MANEWERVSRCTDVSELSTPPIVQHWKTKGRRAKGKVAAPPKTRPPKGRKKRQFLRTFIRTARIIP
jgi:hypothetical protein